MTLFAFDRKQGLFEKIGVGQNKTICLIDIVEYSVTKTVK